MGWYCDWREPPIDLLQRSCSHADVPRNEARTARGVITITLVAQRLESDTHARSLLVAFIPAPSHGWQEIDGIENCDCGHVGFRAKVKPLHARDYFLLEHVRRQIARFDLTQGDAAVGLDGET